MGLECKENEGDKRLRYPPPYLASGILHGEISQDFAACGKYGINF
jgi:hypothetical protein